MVLLTLYAIHHLADSELVRLSPCLVHGVAASVLL